MEIAIMGEGEVVIRFIDRRGQTLLQERLIVSGPPDVQALRYVSLSIGTLRGRVDLAPVVSSLGTNQRVTFDNEDPARFVRRQCRAIGCNARVARDAERGLAPPPTPRNTGVDPISEPVMTDVLAAAPRRPGRRRRG